MTSQHNDPEPDSTDMIQAARQDPKAFGGLYQHYVRQVFRYIYSRIGNMQEAEDLTAQTFLAAFESLDRLRQDGHFVSWLFSIARNKVTDHYRRKNRSASFDEVPDIAAQDDPLSGVIQSEQTADLSRLIHNLPEAERELLRLRFLADMSYPEVARCLHRNKDAVKKSIYRLLARLQSQLEVSNE